MLEMERNRVGSYTINLDVPNEVLFDLNTTGQMFLDYAKKTIAMDLYKNKNVSLGYCAELAEMTKEDFIVFLGVNKVSIFEFREEQEFLQEARNA
jgi:hypothetical protein